LTPLLLPGIRSLRIHWPLTTGHCSPATRHSPLPPRPLPRPVGSDRLRTFRRWLLPDADRRIGEDRTGPDLVEWPLYIQYVTEPGDSCGKVNPFFPFAAAKPLTILSWPKALNAGSSKRAGRMAISRNAWPPLALMFVPCRCLHGESWVAKLHSVQVNADRRDDDTWLTWLSPLP